MYRFMSTTNRHRMRDMLVQTARMQHDDAQRVLERTTRLEVWCANLEDPGKSEIRLYDRAGDCFFMRRIDA